MWKRIRVWLHDHLKWHAPSEKVGFDGCSFISICHFCKKRILQDSQGGWF